MGKFNLDEDEFEIKPVRRQGKKQEKPKVEKAEKTEKPKKEAGKQEDKNPVTLSSTRGRKGQKLPTMNMRFTPDNYEYMRREGAVRGMTTTAFVNWLIETYRSDPKHVHYTDDFKEDEGWNV